MIQIKLLGLALVTVFALGAVAVTSASAALPEFDGPFPIHFTALQLGVGIVETVGKRTIECTHSSALGFINGPKDVLVNSSIITGCKSTTFGAGKCQNGATKGEIKTLAFLGLLGYITASTKLVGLLFESYGSINNIASFECETLLGSEKLTVKGTVICHLSPTNVTTKNYHLECKQKNGVQEPLSFDGVGTKDLLLLEGQGPENFAFEQLGVSGLSDILTLTSTKINA